MSLVLILHSPFSFSFPSVIVSCSLRREQDELGDKWDWNERKKEEEELMRVMDK